MTAYTPPDPDELRALMRELGLRPRDVAELVGVDPRAVRRWLSTSGDSRAMSFMALYTLLGRSGALRRYECGDIRPESWREDWAEARS